MSAPYFGNNMIDNGDLDDYSSIFQTAQHQQNNSTEFEETSINKWQQNSDLKIEEMSLDDDEILNELYFKPEADQPKMFSESASIALNRPMQHSSIVFD